MHILQVDCSLKIYLLVANACTSRGKGRKTLKSYSFNASLAKVARKMLWETTSWQFFYAAMFLQKARRDFSKQQSADRFFGQLLTQLKSVTTCILFSFVSCTVFLSYRCFDVNILVSVTPLSSYKL
jgi:hypothetical protein